MKLCEEAEGSIRRRRGIRPCNAREGGGGVHVREWSLFAHVNDKARARKHEGKRRSLRAVDSGHVEIDQD